VPHVRHGVRGPKKMGEAHNCFLLYQARNPLLAQETHSKQIIRRQ
jgi:hypothetical protein